MKKKGLIVATIVMVLVLAASITTATYAWFTATAQTTIEAISFSVNAGSDVSIGLKADNTYSASPASSAFKSGTTAIGTGFAAENAPNGTIPTTGSEYWTGDTGLGSAIDTQLDLSGITKAVGTGNITAAADAAFDFTKVRTVAVAADGDKGMIKGEGTGAVSNAGTVERAFAQRDYLDVVIGVQAAATDLYSIVCNVTINPDANDLDLGMNAAIHVAWAIDGMIDATHNNDTTDGVYGTNHYGTTTAALAKTLVGGNTNTVPYGGIVGQVLNDGAINLPIPVTEVLTGTHYIPRSKIYQIHLLIWIDGTDSDCIMQAQGVASEIFINFSTTHPERA